MFMAMFMFVMMVMVMTFMIFSAQMRHGDTQKETRKNCN
jgi:preprotein translocase subunit YajC